MDMSESSINTFSKEGGGGDWNGRREDRTRKTVDQDTF